MTQQEVITCGLVVSKTYNWLCGSPDGIVIDENGERVVLEIKCPVSCHNKPINVSYLEAGKLKESHDYFTQVQILMYLCKAERCDFFIWSSVDCKCIEIKLDLEFV